MEPKMPQGFYNPNESDTSVPGKTKIPVTPIPPVMPEVSEPVTEPTQPAEETTTKDAANEPEKNESVESATSTLKDQMDNLSPEEKISVLNGYANLVGMEARKNSLYAEIDKQKEKVASIQKFIDGPEEEAEFIEEKLREVKTIEELQARIKTEAGLNYFFTNPETGELLGVSDVIEEKKKDEFRRSYLVFLKNNQIAMDGIDAELEKYNQAIDEFDADIKDVMAVMADNVLAYTEYLRQSIPEDHPNYNKVMRTAKYIDSAYDMTVFNEILDRYPSIIKHTVEDFHSERRTKEIGSRYFKKLASAHITSSLIGFVSDDPADSYEYKALLPDQYQRGMENLFVFSLIRFFATESWSDQDVRKCHASVIVALRKLVSPNISDDLKAKMRTAISSYLKRFYE